VESSKRQDLITPSWMPNRHVPTLRADRVVTNYDPTRQFLLWYLLPSLIVLGIGVTAWLRLP
jgi:hypothetical protein